MTETPTVELPPCDPEIMATGTLVLTSHTIAAADMEKWVQSVAAKSGQRVDWHFAGGRACVIALGDLAAVRAAIRELMPEHDDLQRKYVAELWRGYPEEISHFRPSCVHYEDGFVNSAYEIFVRPRENAEGGA